MAAESSSMKIIVPADESDDTLNLRAFVEELFDEKFPADRPDWTRGENGRRQHLKCVGNKLVFDCNASKRLRELRAELCKAAGRVYIYLRGQELEEQDLSAYVGVISEAMGVDYTEKIKAMVRQPVIPQWELTEAHVSRLLIACAFENI